MARSGRRPSEAFDNSLGDSAYVLAHDPAYLDFMYAELVREARANGQCLGCRTLGHDDLDDDALCPTCLGDVPDDEWFRSGGGQ